MQKLIGSIPVSSERGDQKDEDGIHSSYSSGRSGTYIPPFGKVSSLYPSLQEDLQPTSLSKGVPLNSFPEAALIYGGLAVGPRIELAWKLKPVLTFPRQTLKRLWRRSAKAKAKAHEAVIVS
jgi:hypothetical protein